MYLKNRKMSGLSDVGLRSSFSSLKMMASWGLNHNVLCEQRTRCILLGYREYSPTQLRGHKIAVGGILCGIRIHQANELLATTLLLRVEFQLGKYRVEA